MAADHTGADFALTERFNRPSHRRRQIHHRCRLIRRHPSRQQAVMSYRLLDWFRLR